MNALIIGSNLQSLSGYRDQIQEKQVFLACSSYISSCMPASISALAIYHKGITVHTTVNLLIITDFPPHTHSNTCTESFPAFIFTAYCILKGRSSHFLPSSMAFILYLREIYLPVTSLDYNKALYIGSVLLNFYTATELCIFLWLLTITLVHMLIKGYYGMTQTFQ